MALTEDEVQQVKYHLGYSNLTALARPYIDLAVVFELIVARNLSQWGEGQVRLVILPRLTELESEIFSQRTRRKAAGVDEIKLNPRELQDLLEVRAFWIGRLEVVCGVTRAVTRGGSIDAN